MSLDLTRYPISVERMCRPTILRSKFDTSGTRGMLLRAVCEATNDLSTDWTVLAGSSLEYNERTWEPNEP